MRHSSGVVTQHLASERFAHKTTVDFITHLPHATLIAIKTFEPDLTHFQTHRTVFRKPPALTIVQQRRIALLRPWQTLAGWTALGSFALLFLWASTVSTLSARLSSLRSACGSCFVHCNLPLPNKSSTTKSGLVTFWHTRKTLIGFPDRIQHRHCRHRCRRNTHDCLVQHRHADHVVFRHLVASP